MTKTGPAGFWVFAADLHTHTNKDRQKTHDKKDRGERRRWIEELRSAILIYYINLMFIPVLVTHKSSQEDEDSD